MSEPLCRHLRWKSFAREAAGTDDLRWSLRRRQVPFSCLRTCEAWGPDDELVSDAECTPQRACFVPLPPR